MDNNSENETDAGIPQYLTRTEVAEQLDISIATVRRLEGKRLHPEKNERGVWIFDPSEVSEVAAIRATAKRYRRTSKGEIAARVFEMLEERADLKEIVIALRQTPQDVRKLYAEWLIDLRTGETLRRRKESRKNFEQQFARQRRAFGIIE